MPADIKPSEDAVRQQNIQMAVESGLPPMELKFSGIYHCYSRLPIAYRTDTVVNSLQNGPLGYDDYSFAISRGKEATELAKWSIITAFKCIEKFIRAHKNFEWISVRCPVSLATDIVLYDWIKELIEKNNFKHPEKLCLEFPSTILYESAERARKSILDMKLLGVHTLLADCAGDDNPISQLINIPFETVLLSPSVTKYAADRNKAMVIPSLIAYLKSMRVEIIADGITDDEQLTVFNSSDCAGYIASHDYSGKAEHLLGGTLEKAIADHKGED